jgi:hypothetical protein
MANFFGEETIVQVLSDTYADNLRGTRPFWLGTRRELTAMVRGLDYNKVYL